MIQKEKINEYSRGLMECSANTVTAPSGQRFVKGYSLTKLLNLFDISIEEGNYIFNFVINKMTKYVKAMVNANMQDQINYYIDIPVPALNMVMKDVTIDCRVFYLLLHEYIIPCNDFGVIYSIANNVVYLSGIVEKEFQNLESVYFTAKEKYERVESYITVMNLYLKLDNYIRCMCTTGNERYYTRQWNTVIYSVFDNTVHDIKKYCGVNNNNIETIFDSMDKYLLDCVSIAFKNIETLFYGERKAISIMMKEVSEMRNMICISDWESHIKPISNINDIQSMNCLFSNHYNRYM